MKMFVICCICIWLIALLVCVVTATSLIEGVIGLIFIFVLLHFLEKTQEG